METSREGIRTLWISLATLGATAVVQAHQLAVAAERTNHLTAPGLRDQHEPLAHNAPDG